MYAVFLAILSVITLCRTDETHIAEIVFVPGRNKLRAIRVWPLQTHLDNTTDGRRVQGGLILSAEARR